MRLHIPIRLRWADLDAYGHVNNAEMLRLLEEARILAFWMANDASPNDDGATTAVLEGHPDANTLTLIARQSIEYLAPVPYLRQPLDIQLWLGRLGGSSLEVCYEVWNPEGVLPRIVYARAAATIVLVDAVTERPRRITTPERAAWSPYVEQPIKLSRPWPAEESQ